jgi:Uncharacterized protein conserved in bacteria
MNRHPEECSMENPLFLGLDIGSTTVKLAFLDASASIIHTDYQRHFSDIGSALESMLQGAAPHVSGARFIPAIAGSAGMALSKAADIPFVQEVIASTISLRHALPDTDVAIELGGEDAKITFFSGSIDQRMNETCAGGTGAFIDQMASFLQTDASGLNDLASRHTTIYPIAARCGVFAKTDIMPLLNEGAAREDIAASIFQAVVDQTVGGLACGRIIQGRVAFLGGPLHFLPELRKRFIKTLGLAPDQVLFPQNALCFVALGAALEMRRCHEGRSTTRHTAAPREWDLEELAACIRQTVQAIRGETAPLPPLFATKGEYREFQDRHARNTTPRAPLHEHRGPVFLGMDIGSTTIKAAVIDKKGTLLHSHYSHSQGEPLAAARNILSEIYAALPDGAYLARSGATGYGSGLIRSAFGVDVDEVETVAHFRAARALHPQASFILDIGGQDMKCMHIADGVIDRIMLNEACSAGCGVFIETFAKSLGMDNALFVAQAIKSKKPVDLGSRCTVFMNSKVKQAQKEGATVGDIAAGLAYSVIRNTLYKVIKAPDASVLGSHVVAQGGAFFNDALLRAFELLLGRTIFRPDISGLMGAYGVALMARAEWSDLPAPAVAQSSLITAEALADFNWESKTQRCKGCGNRCLITINRFNTGGKHCSGNRCEKGGIHAGIEGGTPAANLYSYKYRRLFDFYTPLPAAEAPRGVVGIPRALNMYENYPFWFTLFTRLGFRVELSAPSSKKLYNSGISTIPSQTACYPAKLAHGHVLELARSGVKHIFFPCISNEDKEFSEATGTYNCPVVTGYPELLRLNIEELADRGVTLHTPFLPLDKADILASQLVPLLDAISRSSPPGKREIARAIGAAVAEKERFRTHMQRVGKRVLNHVLSGQGPEFAVVLSGHPYHIDPGINHGIADMIAAMGVAVLTEDSVAHLKSDGPMPALRAVNQWTYHARLYRAAAISAQFRRASFVQLTSFGCGLDAITSEQAQEIVESSGRLYTLLKIDEGANLGAARIRIRSLLAAEQARAGRRNAPRRQEARRVAGPTRRPPGSPPGGGFMHTLRSRNLPGKALHTLHGAASVPVLPILAGMKESVVSSIIQLPVMPDSCNLCSNYAGLGTSSELTTPDRSLLLLPRTQVEPQSSGKRGKSMACTSCGARAAPPVFTEAMRQTHTLLVPQLSPVHFTYVEMAVGADGYKVELLPHVCREAIEIGLQYVNNDMCYPALMTVGQLILAVRSGRYDTRSIALLMSQTGGGCRATNYIPFLRKALEEAGFGHIPVLSFNICGLGDHPGFSVSSAMLKRIIRGAILGDVLARLYYRTRPYEMKAGTTDAVLGKMLEFCEGAVLDARSSVFVRTLDQVAASFACIPVRDEIRPKVGVVGEIYLRYNSDANNNVMNVIEAEGGEAVPGDIVNFLLYCLYDDIFRAKNLGGPLSRALKKRFFIWWVERLRSHARKVFARYPRFGHIATLYELADMAASVIGLGHQTGEGWLLTAEMIDYLESGVPNVVCLQPFACLPNHITGKGVIKELKKRYPLANIAAVDYDSGASEVNQLNRIKLMMAVAHNNLAR